MRCAFPPVVGSVELHAVPRHLAALTAGVAKEVSTIDAFEKSSSRAEDGRLLGALDLGLRRLIRSAAGRLALLVLD